MRGIGHVDERIPLLAMPLPMTLGLPVATPGAINRTAMRRARNRPEAYRRSGVGTDYDNFILTGTVLERPERPLRTAFTWAKSLRALLNLALTWLAFYVLVITLNGLEQALALPLPWNMLLVAGLLIAPVALSAPFFWRYARAAFIDLPVDSFLADFGRAVADAYRSSGLAPMSPDQVRVRLNESGPTTSCLTTGTRRWSINSALVSGAVRAEVPQVDISPMAEQHPTVRIEEDAEGADGEAGGVTHPGPSRVRPRASTSSIRLPNESAV